MTKRVVVTGMGIVSPLGNHVEEFWQNIASGKNGIDFITRFNTDDFKAKLAAEVKDFDAEKYMQKKETKRMDLFTQYALAAACDAVSMSQLPEEYIKGNYRVGVIVGSGIGGLATMEDNILKLGEKGPSKVSPLFIPMAIGNMAAGQISIRFGAKGICTSVVTACASATHCIGEAFRSIKHGYSDVVLAGGAEASITQIGIAGFTSLTALSTSQNKDRASIPFDEERGGFVMGEGAGILVLESLEHAQARNATIYGEIVGYGATGDAYHMTAPDSEGSGAAVAISLAISESGLQKEDITYINAHGTGTQLNDLPETNAIKAALGDYAYNIPVSSSKSMTGHLLGAAGAIEAIVCLKALENDFVPPTIGLQKPGEGCDLNYVPNVGIKKPMVAALSNSLGFGGHNAVLCMKKWEAK